MRCHRDTEPRDLRRNRQEWEAMGLRLRQCDDDPHYVQNGFADEYTGYNEFGAHISHV
jgi:hypothetical protein